MFVEEHPQGFTVTVHVQALYSRGKILRPTSGSPQFVFQKVAQMLFGQLFHEALTCHGADHTGRGDSICRAL